MTPQKTILFDGRFISLSNAGLGRYSSELFKNLLKINNDQFNLKLLVLPKTELDDDIKREIKNNSSVDLVEFDAEHFSYKEQIKLKKLLDQIKPDLVHFTNLNHPVLYKGKFVVTIHDLTLYQFAERASKFKRLAYDFAIKKAVKNSEKIFTVSEYAKNQMLEKFSIPREKIEVTYNGIDEKFKKITNPKVLNRIRNYSLDKPYFLYVGQWRSHKNLLFLVKAFRVLLDKGFQNKINLVFAGKIDPKYPELTIEVKKNKLEDAVIFTGFVEDDDLPIIYNNAISFVFPSLSEGFGLPALEAQACSTPVISSSKTSLPEVLGKGALYFDPRKEDELVTQMEKILTDDKLKDQLIKEGESNVKRFSWQQCAQKTLEVYKELLYK